MADSSGIASSLFESVDEYCTELDSGKRSIDDALEKNQPLVLFAENFLEQFSASNLRQKITGFNDRSAKQLVAERRRLQRGSEQPAAQRLIFQLEHFCTQVGEVSYSSSETDAEDFHLQYFPQLLERVVDWLNEAGADADTQDSANDALVRYNGSVGL